MRFGKGTKLFQTNFRLQIDQGERVSQEIKTLWSVAELSLQG